MRPRLAAASGCEEIVGCRKQWSSALNFRVFRSSPARRDGAVCGWAVNDRQPRFERDHRLAVAENWVPRRQLSAKHPACACRGCLRGRRESWRRQSWRRKEKGRTKAPLYQRKSREGVDQAREAWSGWNARAESRGGTPAMPQLTLSFSQRRSGPAGPVRSDLPGRAR
jgi:hypothetical protein